MAINTFKTTKTITTTYNPEMKGEVSGRISTSLRVKRSGGWIRMREIVKDEIFSNLRIIELSHNCKYQGGDGRGNVMVVV